jgi:hypothetical protein
MSFVIPRSVATRNLLPRAVPHANHYRALLPFFLTLQNELTPNHTNVAVKQIATTTRPNPVCPAWYFVYSRTAAPAPLSAITRKISPATCNHNSCRTRPKARAVVATALPDARTNRFR